MVPGADPWNVHLLRCLEDCAHFLDSHGRIYNQENADIPFTLYQWQRDVLREWQNNRKWIGVKTRGIGLSWLVAGYILWQAGIRNKRVVVGSRTEDMAVDLMDRANYIRRNMSDVFPMEVNQESTQRVSFKSRGVMLSVAASPNMGSGLHPSVFILDEWAKLEQDDAIMSSVMPAVGDVGQLIGFSSPFGFGNQFQMYWDGATSGRNKFAWRVLHWKDLWARDPRWRDLFDDGWYERQCDNLNHDKARIAQELDCDFVQSGSPVFEQEDVDKVFGWVRQRSSHASRRPNPGEVVIVAIDPSSGEAQGGSDQTSIDVIGGDDGAQIWHESWKKPAPEARERLYRLLAQFDRPVIVIERNGVGMMIAKWLSGGQWRVVEVHSLKGTQEDGPAVTLAGRKQERTKTDRWWWRVGVGTMVYGLQADIEHHAFKAYDPLTRAQLMTFTRTGPDTFAAPRNMHDDCVSSLALGRWAYRKNWAKHREERPPLRRAPVVENKSIFDDME
jgi:hypothetical protein